MVADHEEPGQAEKAQTHVLGRRRLRRGGDQQAEEAEGAEEGRDRDHLHHRGFTLRRWRRENSGRATAGKRRVAGVEGPGSAGRGEEAVKVAFMGLGVMGYPMAGHLAAAGHEVTVFNRTPAKAEGWTAQHGGTSAPTPAEAARGCDIVFACVGDDSSVREVVCAAGGAVHGMRPGALFVDHTTASADVAREMAAALGAHGVRFVDAPVSGGQAGAETGQLTIMAGGSEEDFERARPVMECYGKAVTRMGDVGAGQLCKMANQICIAGLVQGLAEGLNFAERAGLDGETVIEVISKGAAGSWQMVNRGHTMLRDEYDFGFAVDWMRKDLAIALAEASRNGALLPVAALVDQFYAEVQRLGGRRWDTSSLMHRLKRAP